MPRPKKFRRVEFFPQKTFFYPEGFNEEEDIVNDEKSVTLNYEEVEAMRLKDIEKLNQEECANCMEISRQTFQNIIDSAREKVAVALTQGKAIKISGGHFTIKECRYICGECGESYQINVEGDKNTCPRCSSEKVGCKRRRRRCNRCGN